MNQIVDKDYYFFGSLKNRANNFLFFDQLYPNQIKDVHVSFKIDDQSKKIIKSFNAEPSINHGIELFTNDTKQSYTNLANRSLIADYNSMRWFKCLKLPQGTQLPEGLSIIESKNDSKHRLCFTKAVELLPQNIRQMAYDDGHEHKVYHRPELDQFFIRDGYVGVPLVQFNDRWNPNWFTPAKLAYILNQASMLDYHNLIQRNRLLQKLIDSDLDQIDSSLIYKYHDFLSILAFHDDDLRFFDIIVNIRKQLDELIHSGM